MKGRRRVAIAVLAVLCAAVVAAAASAATPNLTGSWTSPTSPSSPPWMLHASADRSTLDGTWTGGGGHSALMGSFHATLNGSGTAYVGTFHITEAGNFATGPISFAILSPHKISITIQSTSCGACSHAPSTFTLVRHGQQQTIHASFHGYANDVKVYAPLVGPWQLGVSHFNGTVTITPIGAAGATSITGTITDTFAPLYSRYPATSMSLQVTGYSYEKTAAATKLVLAVQILTTSGTGARCVTGDKGTLTLQESAVKLSNGQRSDLIAMEWGPVRCPQYEQGWKNADGGPKTSPPYGGPPSGGQWAIVRITP
jgi:hypothetical protein